MKSWFNSSDLAGLPGLPSSSRAVLLKAKRENWKSRAHKGLGGGKDFHYKSLPDETRAALATRNLGTTERKSSNRRSSIPLNRSDITHAILELSRIQEKQEVLLTEGKRLIAAILSSLVETETKNAEDDGPSQ